MVFVHLHNPEKKVLKVDETWLVISNSSHPSRQKKQCKVSTLRIILLSYSLVMDAFRLLEPENISDGKMKPRIPNVAVEITKEYRLTLEREDKTCNIRV